jgi:flagellar basal body L-ring protein FlgH
MVLTGTCRAEDVTADNSVLSTQLHDLTVKKTHTGEVRNAGRKGWIPKIVDIINPF